MEKQKQQIAVIRNHLKYGNTNDALSALLDMIEEQMTPPAPPVTDQAPPTGAESQTA